MTIKYLRADWDLWDDGETFKEWIACGLLSDGVNPVFVLEERDDGHVKYVDLRPRSTKNDQECCFVYGTTGELLYNSPSESVLAYARWDVDYYEKALAQAKQVLSYVEEKLAAGKTP